MLGVNEIPADAHTLGNTPQIYESHNMCDGNVETVLQPDSGGAAANIGSMLV